MQEINRFKKIYGCTVYVAGLLRLLSYCSFSAVTRPSARRFIMAA